MALTREQLLENRALIESRILDAKAAKARLEKEPYRDGDAIGFLDGRIEHLEMRMAKVQSELSLAKEKERVATADRDREYHRQFVGVAARLLSPAMWRQIHLAAQSEAGL